jgi:uncharacterized protein
MDRIQIGPALETGPLDLLVLQATPFCNLDCSYCYLPDRLSKKRISIAVLDRIFAEVFSSGLVRQPFTVVWHAGEPLVLAPSFYREAIEIVASHNSTRFSISHSFQTNGTLIDDAWCDFIIEHDLRIGVSVDGPDFLHDQVRKTRSGEGTHSRVVAGMRRLRERQIPFHVISVLTRASLDYPDELFDFYVSQGVSQVGFNIEEIEGPNILSSLNAPYVRESVVRFLSRFYDLVERSGTPMQIREFEGARSALLTTANTRRTTDQQTKPLAIVSVDCEGNFSTFSPELLGLTSKHYGNFALGNLMRDSLKDAAQSPRLQQMWDDIQAGLKRCQTSCSYFNYCGGGAPVNKYFENGTFDSAETMFCRLSRKAVLDVVLDKLERDPIRRPS